MLLSCSSLRRLFRSVLSQVKRLRSIDTTNAPTAATELFESKSKPAYAVRVSGTVFLWGSASLTSDLTFKNPLLLHVRNNLYGAPVTLATQKADGTVSSLGSVNAGECVTIPVQTVCGVSATCAAGTDSVVACLIDT